MKRSFIREILEYTNSNTISFAGGLPDEKLFPLEVIRDCANSALQSAKVLQYAKSSGLDSLRELIAQSYTKRGFKTSPEEILITSGSQQALDVILRSIKSQNITVEAPSYLGAMNLFALNGIKTEAVELKENGIELNSFKQSVANTKLAYLIPDFQNPTGISYSQECRDMVAKEIKEHNGILIEDAPYSELYFEEFMPPISSKIPNSSYHLGSFSKTLAPALRVGWIRASKKLLKPLLAYKEVMDLHTNMLSQEIISCFLSKHKLYEEHLENIRNSYKSKMEFFTQELDKKIPEFNYIKPKGGMFVYVKTDVDVYKLLERTMQNGVVFVPGGEFYSDNKNRNEIRFNYTNSTQEQISKGIELITEATHYMQYLTNQKSDRYERINSLS